MTQQSGQRSPREDEQQAHETQGLVQGGHGTRAEEWRDPEPAGEDQPTGDVGILPEDRRGTPPGMDSGDVEERSEIARFLGLSAFPGTKEQLLSVAAEHQATDHVRSLLQRLPDGQEFENMQEVARAIGLGTEETRT